MTTTPDITPDFRALCAELLDELEYQTSYETNAENCAALQDRARAELATLPPKPPTVEDLLKVYNEAESADYDEQHREEGEESIDVDWRRCQAAGLRAVLERWGQ